MIINVISNEKVKFMWFYQVLVSNQACTITNGGFFLLQISDHKTQS
jgi:hypothetical protein